MMQGYEAYGLGARGDANREAARAYILNKISQNGHARIYCLNETVQSCIAQVNFVAGPLYALGSIYMKEELYLIDFIERASFLNLNGFDFLNLPSEVGITENSGRVTERRAGFIVYGPYVPLKSGRYLLSVVGSATRLNGAYVDVVSDKGASVHARFDLAKRADNYLIRNVEVVLPLNINDLEVRIWVGENDEIKLLSYSLNPF
jgi:hypothetical protein